MGMTKIIVSGRLGKKLELKNIGPDTKYAASGTIANAESFKNKSGNWETKTRWIDFTAYDEVAERAAKADVGDTLILIGEIRQNVYTKDEKTVSRLYVVVRELFGIIPKGTKGWLDINQVILKGRKCQDWEAKICGSSSRVISGSLACSRYKKSETGETWEESTDWINISAFDRRADRLENIPKGSLIYLEGKFEVDTVEKDGEKKTYQKIQVGRVNGFVLAGKKSEQTADTPDTVEEEAVQEAAQETAQEAVQKAVQEAVQDHQEAAQGIPDIPDFMKELNMSLEDIPFV